MSAGVKTELARRAALVEGYLADCLRGQIGRAHV
jgi:hypothetical protein